MGDNTGNASFSIVVGSSWAIGNTVAIKKNRVSFAGGAASAHGKEKVEREVPEIAKSGESEVVSVPGGRNLEIGAIIIEDETVKSIEIDHISGKVGGRVEDQVGGWNVCVEEVSAHNDVLEFTSITYVTDQNGVDLGDRCNRDCDCNTSFIDFLVDDLDFEGRVAAKNLSRRYFKSLNECHGVDRSLEV